MDNKTKRSKEVSVCLPRKELLSKVVLMMRRLDVQKKAFCCACCAFQSFAGHDCGASKACTLFCSRIVRHSVIFHRSHQHNRDQIGTTPEVRQKSDSCEEMTFNRFAALICHHLLLDYCHLPAIVVILGTHLNPAACSLLQTRASL